MPRHPVIIEQAVGNVDGINCLFRASMTYIAGSLEVFLDGQAKRADFDDGWVEQGGVYFLMKQAPLLGSVVQVYYRPQ